MNFRFFNRRVLAAGLVLTAIFITISTASIVCGAEPNTAVTEQHSRLHPKRIFGGLKRGISKLFGHDKHELTPTPEEMPLPQTPPPAVAQQINKQRIAHETARRVRDPFVRPHPARAIAGKSSMPLTAPAAALPATAKRTPPVKVNIAGLRATATDTAKADSEDENPFAEFDFDAAMDKSAAKVVDAAISAAKPAAAKTVLRASQQRRTAPEVKHLLGYCPVNLRAGKFERGKPEFTTVYQGRSYSFDSQEALNEFVRNPHPYAPVLQGIDVIEMQRTGRHVEGYLSYSCDYDGQFYLFRTTENQDEFLADPARYAVPR